MISKKQWKENNNDSDLCYNDFVLSIKRIDNWSIYYGKEMNKVVMGELIDKAAVVSEIEGYISNYKDIVAKTDRNDSTWVDSVSMIDAKIDVLRHLLSFLNTIEVKEVDFDKEINEWMEYGPHTSYPWCTIPDAIKITAEHFFELGLKAKGK